ncbi:F-actin-capping protein subunit alpha [Savitreella phatthalungensis]
MPSGKDIFSLIASTGPGQLTEVTKDIKQLVGDADKYEQASAEVLADYHLSQHSTVNVDGNDMILSEYNALDAKEGRFFDVTVGREFKVDFKTLKTTDIKPYDKVPRISALGDALQKYRAEHYPSQSAVTIVPNKEKPEHFVILIVGTKFNQANFWTGRWRNTYFYDPANGLTGGTIEVDVHYFEDGNVRLLVRREIAAMQSSSSELPNKLADLERDFQEELNRTLTELGDGAFRQLRRQLPVTRSKINWQSIGAMRIGQDVQGGREK